MPQEYIILSKTNRIHHNNTTFDQTNFNKVFNQSNKSDEQLIPTNIVPMNSITTYTNIHLYDDNNIENFATFENSFTKMDTSSIDFNKLDEHERNFYEDLK